MFCFAKDFFAPSVPSLSFCFGRNCSASLTNAVGNTDPVPKPRPYCSTLFQGPGKRCKPGAHRGWRGEKEIVERVMENPVIWNQRARIPISRNVSPARYLPALVRDDAVSTGNLDGLLSLRLICLRVAVN